MAIEDNPSIPALRSLQIWGNASCEAKVHPSPSSHLVLECLRSNYRREADVSREKTLTTSWYSSVLIEWLAEFDFSMVKIVLLR
jgi:hypothetical protein